MPRRCVGLIGKGVGPLICVREPFKIEVKGIGDGLVHVHLQNPGGMVPHSLDSDGIHLVTEEPTGFVQVEYRGSSPSFICNVLIGE